MLNQDNQLSFLEKQSAEDNTPVVCLGMTFESEEARRDYFREELRKKLPELKNIEGFPIGEDEDIIALSDPPYYTACPNPWINDFIEQWEKANSKEVKNVVPYSLDVIEGKSDPLYNAHSYHTKVPHKAIMHLILHYTNPGDIIYDGFCGTGMTGVASILCGNKKEVESLGYKVNDNGEIFKKIDTEWVCFSKMGERKAVLNDLSPIATFISSNYNIPHSTTPNMAESVIGNIEKDYGLLYLTANESLEEKVFKQIYDDISHSDNLQNYIEIVRKYHEKGLLHKINYTIFSDFYSCDNCAQEFIYWDEAIDQEELVVKESFNCPSCNSILSKSNMSRSKSTSYDVNLDGKKENLKRDAVLINYFDSNNRKKIKKVDKLDKLIIKKISDFASSEWYPTDLIPVGDKTKEPIKLGLTHTNDYYSNRNLLILSKLWKESSDNEILRLGLTSVLVKTASLLHNVGLKNGNINLAGALPNAIYIPSILAERNIFELLRGKIQDIERANLERIHTNNIVSCHSITAPEFRNSLKEKMDYIFIDPPFGANLMYSELNFLWESWLSVKTNNISEAIENKTQKKGLIEYHKLMRESFLTAYELLKPNGWITIEFSNTKAQVWNVIQLALQEVGFVIANVSALSKGQGTFNAQTNPTSVKQDLIISAYKPLDRATLLNGNPEDINKSIWQFTSEHLNKIPKYSGQDLTCEYIIERSPRIIYDRMVSYFFQRNQQIPMSSAEFQSGIAQRFPMRDGMAFLESQVAEYDKKRILVKEFSQMNIFVSDENSAIEWLRQKLLKKPQTSQDLHPQFMKEIQHIAKHEQLPELNYLLQQNFLRYEGDEVVPDQIGSYLRRNYHDFRGLENNVETMKDKALNRWYVPDPNKQADLEKLREKSLLREFDSYIEELGTHKKKLKQFRTEAIRAGFKKAWSDKDYAKIITVGDRLPESVVQEDDKLLMYYDNAQIRLDM